MSANAQTQPQTKQAPKQEPFVHLILGVGYMLAWIAGMQFQVNTTETWFLHHAPPGSGEAWGMLSQLWILLSGQAAGAGGEAMLVGWGVEIVTLTFGLVYEVARHSAWKSGDAVKGIITLLLWGITILNFVSDVLYGSAAQGIWGQLLLGAVAAFFAVFMLPLSLEQFIRMRRS